MLFPLTDVVCCLLLLLFLLVARERVLSVTWAVDGVSLTAADYSVLVRGLPRDATQEQVLRHFDTLYNLEEEDWTFPGHCCCIGRKMWKRDRERGARPSTSKVSGPCRFLHCT